MFSVDVQIISGRHQMCLASYSTHAGCICQCVYTREMQRYMCAHMHACLALHIAALLQAGHTHNLHKEQCITNSIMAQNKTSCQRELPHYTSYCAWWKLLSLIGRILCQFTQDTYLNVLVSDNQLACIRIGHYVLGMRHSTLLVYAIFTHSSTPNESIFHFH